MKRTSFNLLALVTILSLTLGSIGVLAQKPKYKLGLTPDDRQYSSLKDVVRILNLEESFRLLTAF
jgi:hypothetical protein